MSNWPVLGLLFLGSAIMPCTGWAFEENLVEMPAGPIYNLNEKGDSSRIPVIIHDGVSVADLDQPILLDVALGKVHDSALLSAFQTSMAPDGSILISVVLDPPLRQGSYDVKLRLHRKGDPIANVKTTQDLSFQIVKPAAQLKIPSTLIVQKVLGLITSDSLVTPPLPLRENSGLSRLNGIDLGQIDNFTSDSGQAANCMLLFNSVPTVSAGQTAWATYKVDCEPTVGTLKGSTRVNAAELASPVDLNVEIRTRRSRSWIGLIAAAGLLIGYLTRIALPLWANRSQVRFQVLNMLAQIDTETDRRKDGQFRQDCGVIRTTLAQTLKSNPKPDLLTAAVTLASSELVKALADLQGRRSAAQGRVDQLAKLVITPWSLPPTIYIVVATAQARLVNAHAALLEDNPQAATDICEDARAELASGLRVPLEDWQNDLLSLADALDAAPVPFSMTLGLKASVDRVRGLVNLVGNPGLDAQLETIEQALSATDVARMAVRQLLLQILRWPQETLAIIKETLRPAPLINTLKVDRLESIASGLLDALRKATLAPETESLGLHSAMKDLENAWRDALLSQTNDPAIKLTIQGSLSLGKYSEAAQEVVESLAAVMPNAIGSGASQPAKQAVLASYAPATVWPGIMGMNIQPRDSISANGWWNVDLSPDKVSALIVRTAEESKVAQFVQTLCAGVGIVLVSYLANGEKFVGTFTELAGVFAWAFVSDITIDALVTSARAIKKN